jgi:hypothetical protein
VVVVLVARWADSQHDLSELPGIYENDERQVSNGREGRETKEDSQATIVEKAG